MQAAQSSQILKSTVIWIWIVVLLELVELNAGNPLVPDFKYYKNLTESATCNFKNYDKITGVHLISTQLNVIFHLNGFKQPFKSTSINITNVSKYENVPLTRVNIDTGQNTNDFDDKDMIPIYAIMADGAIVRPVAKIDIFNYFNLFVYRDITNEEDLYILHFSPTAYDKNKISPNVEASIVKCKPFEPSKESVLSFKFGHGSVPLIQNRDDNLWCSEPGKVPINFPVTLINNVDSSYINVSFSLIPLNMGKPSATFYYGFNRMMTEVYFATELRHLQESVPDYIPATWLPKDWHPFLCFDYIYIIAGEWVIYFPLLQTDDPLFHIWSMAVASMKVMHLNNFFKCKPGAKRNLEYPDKKYSLFLTKNQQMFVYIGGPIIGVVLFFAILIPIVICMKQNKYQNQQNTDNFSSSPRSLSPRGGSPSSRSRGVGSNYTSKYSSFAEGNSRVEEGGANSNVGSRFFGSRASPSREGGANSNVGSRFAASRASPSREGGGGGGARSNYTSKYSSFADGNSGVDEGRGNSNVGSRFAGLRASPSRGGGRGGDRSNYLSSAGSVAHSANSMERRRHSPQGRKRNPLGQGVTISLTLG